MQADMVYSLTHSFHISPQQKSERAPSSFGAADKVVYCRGLLLHDSADVRATCNRTMDSP